MIWPTAHLPSNIHEAVRCEYMYKSLLQNWEKRSAIDQLTERVNNTEYYQLIQTAKRVVELIREYHEMGVDGFVNE